VGEYRDRPAEGMQVVTTALVDGLRALGKEVDVMTPKTLMAWIPLLFLKRAAAVIFTHGPGPGTLLLSGLVKRISAAQIVWLAPRPAVSNASRFLLRFAHVDSILSSRRTAELDAVLAHSGGRHFPTVHGIDLSRFSAEPQRAEAACKGGGGRPFGPGKPVVLHVGHVKANRGLEQLAVLKEELKETAEVVVLGSPTFPPDEAVMRRLVDAGVQVLVGFVDDLAAWYRLAALYVFPADNDEGGAVDLPLSVLEARACGTPVVTTPYGSLPDVLSGCDGVAFVQPDGLIDVCVRSLQEDGVVRKKMTPLDRSFDLACLPEKVLAVTGD